jgi:FixJ family two-component response regulator
VKSMPRTALSTAAKRKRYGGATYFIAKPFLATALLARVNDVLHSDVREQGTDHFDTRR